MTSVFKFVKTQLLAKNQFAKALFIAANFVISAQVFAASVAITNSPLVNSTTSQVLPNLMYILDNSGSMGMDAMPDYVDNNPNMCKANDAAGTFSTGCRRGDPPYMSKEFNSIYYNPDITYLPGINPDGTDRLSMTAANTANWTQVPNDAYGIQSNALDSLVPTTALPYNNGYADKVWCNIGNPTNAQLFDPAICQANSQYSYPTSVFTTSKTRFGHPYYYNIVAGEHCTNANLTSCVASNVPSGTNLVPAKLRWCNSAARTNCQAKYIYRNPSNPPTATDYTFALWSGILVGAAPVGAIKLDPDSANGASPVTLTVTGVTVNGLSIIAAIPPQPLTITDTTNAGQRNTLASRIAAAINAYVSTPTDFIATATNDKVTITPVGVPFNYSATVDDLITTKYPATAFAGVKATGSFTITNSKAPASITSIKVGANEILGVAKSTVGADTAAARIAFASLIVTQINAYSGTNGYTAVSNGASTPKITITAKNVGVSLNGSLTIARSVGGSGLLTIAGVSNVGGGVNPIAADKFTIPNVPTSIAGGTPSVNTFNRVDIEPTTLSYPKGASRSDCGAPTDTTCSYDQEMTNFANWYSYYRTRMQMMKTSTTRAFKFIDQRYRVGFITINNSAGNYLPIADYDNTQKTSWYNTLVAANPGNSTPLRTALSTVGRIYAGKKPVGNSDPVQYSCQQNFSLLTTDGYWNGNGGVQADGVTAIGDMDGAGTGRPQFEGPTASSGSLADVAKYYYDTDLRSTALANCTGALGTDVCLNNVAVSPTDNNVQQHMSTFTLGLGVDGEIGYTPDYQTAAPGDFNSIKNGALNWPVPAANTQSAVDDLWHAAVNGQGQYFSAKDPNTLSKSLNDALQQIGSKIGAGAAAASSTLNPVQGDNSAYVGSYSTVKWTGNLESRDINTNDGVVSSTADWAVESVLPDDCKLPKDVVSQDLFGATVTYCVTHLSTAATCDTRIAGTVLVGTDCKVEISPKTAGKMQYQIGAAPVAPRKILMRNDKISNPALTDFTYANLSTAQQVYFNQPFLSTSLSQWSALTTAQKNIANGANLVNYLRGDIGFEDRFSNSTPIDNRVFRFRSSTLGDLLESTPLFVGKPRLGYNDSGYGPVTDSTSFKALQSSRVGMVFVGANDGMLHAFYARDKNPTPPGSFCYPDPVNYCGGQEAWAYIPSMVIPKLHKLADRNYSTHHENYVNGDTTVADICIKASGCNNAVGSDWRTILIGGLNGGGVGYYALDITNPINPVLLWEFTQANDGDLGVSYGRPFYTKDANGKWVILVTSGYNNTNGANPGKGFLYVIDPLKTPNDSNFYKKYSTGVGDITTPSGFAKINIFATNPDADNTGTYVYGGDLLGNLWRFDINLPEAAGTNPFRVATLKDATGNVQPITVRPELANLFNKRMIYVGTGKYLEVSDLTDTSKQTLYAITDTNDTNATSTLNDPRNDVVTGIVGNISALVKQEILDAGGFRKIKTPANTIDYAKQRGWYIDLPDTGERQNIASRLVDGTLIVPTIVPSNTICSPGGYGWLNYLDYKTGGAVEDTSSTFAGLNLVSTKFSAPIVGVNVYKINNKNVVNVTGANDPTPVKMDVPFDPTASGGKVSRVIWRELMDQ
jgi:type IV pilus assembly protein PilY1